jgi:PTS system mannose-specific IIA component
MHRSAMRLSKQHLMYFVRAPKGLRPSTCVDQDTSEVKKMARSVIERLDGGAGVLVITDVMGGTPSNCTLQLHEAGRVEVIAGISLPMLLRAITYRNDTLDVVVEMALAGGQSGVVRVDNRVRLSPN